MSTIDREQPTPVRSTDPPRGSDALTSADVLDRLRTSRARLVLVHAPPGYGKTTMVSSWVRRQERPVRWIDLDRADNDPAELLSVLVAALLEVTDFDAAGLSTVQGAQEQYSTTVAPRLGRALRRCTRPFILVLDDTHLVVHQPALDLVDALVQHVPAGSMIAIVGRVQPRIALARLRADDEVEEITSADLELDVDAARQLLAGMGVTVDDAEVDRLVSATEGWAVGLRLAGQALLADVRDIGVVGTPRLDRDHVVGQYLREEWLRGLDADELDFLVQASWLDSLWAPFCDDVLDRSDSSEMLERLHADSLLVIPLRRHGDEYRMHQLLRNVLLTESERKLRSHRRTVEKRASAWYEQAGDVDRAIEFALRAGDSAGAERLIAQYAPDRLGMGRSATVQKWLDMCPRPQVLASPTLCLVAAATVNGIGEGATTFAWLEFGRRAVESAGNDGASSEASARLAALRSMMVTSVDEDELAGAAHAYDELAPGVWHAVACCGYGWLSSLAGDDERAARLLTEGAAEARIAGAVTIEIQCRAGLASIFWSMGRRDRAAAAARAARSLVRDHGLEELPTLVLATAMSAVVEASAGDLARAKADIALTRRNLVYVRDVGTWPNLQSRLALAGASMLLGDRVGARTFLDEAAEMVADSPTDHLRKQLDELVGRLQRGRTSLPFGPSSLTTAELRVLHFLPTNLSLSDIAERLHVSRNTAKSHAAAVYRKLGVTSRREAVEVARTVGLLASDIADPSRY